MFMTTLAGLMLTISAVADGAGDARPIGEDRDALRLMTFNIRYGTADDGDDHWRHRTELVFDVLRDHRPDVLGLQEALRFQLDAMREAVPGYAEVGVGRDDGRISGEFSSIFYRVDRFAVDGAGTFWLSDTPEVPGSRSWGNNITRICTWARLVEHATGRGIYVFNTHMDHRSQASRERGVELIVRRITERAYPDPVIFMGDFNAGEDNPVVRYVRGDIPRASDDGPEPAAPPKLVDTFRVKHPDAVRVGTFHGFRGGREGRKIDFIWAPPEFRVLDAEIVYDNRDGRYPSDHYPVTAVLAWPRD